MSSLKTTLAIILFFVLNLTAKPIHSVTDIDAVPTKVFQPLPVSRSRFIKSNAKWKLYNSSDRSRKLHRRIEDFYIWRASPLELIRPLHQVAPVLQVFYHAILAQVNEQWSLQAPLPSFWIKYGNSELFFDSLGWIGTYNIIYQNGAANQAVGVTLRITNNQLSSSQHHLTRAGAVVSAKTTDLKKHNEVHLTSLKVHGAIVPLSVAAPYIKAFFETIAYEASNAWTARPEQALFTVTQGPFQLTVSCLGATTPWLALGSAAQKLSALVDHFWVNTFDAFYEVSESSITLAFSLRLIQEARGLGLTTIALPIRQTLQNRDPPTKSTAPLRARTPSTPMSAGIRIASFIQTAALVPNALAAAKLEDFYNIIALKIETGQMANRVPSKTVVCSLWDFELVFSCEKINVPLSFVQAFAIDMAEWSSKQFTGFYVATVRGEGALNGLVFMVQMRLKGKGQQSLDLR